MSTPASEAEPAEPLTQSPESEQKQGMSAPWPALGPPFDFQVEVAEESQSLPPGGGVPIRAGHRFPLLSEPGTIS